MEKELNIAAILKEKPQNIKLWSPAFGGLKLQLIREGKSFPIHVMLDNNKGYETFTEQGKLDDDGECILFPSKAMRSWEKFAWKKGDVLGYERYVCIFEKWLNDDYTMFVARHLFSELDGYFDKPLEVHSPFNRFVTEYWTKEIYNRNVDFYISKIEEFNNGGKLNLSTLEIEQTKPEFKDGDIVAYGKSVAICRKVYKHTLYFYASLDEMLGLMFDHNNVSIEPYRLATNSEKRQLFDALAKENKRWNPDTLQIEDIPKKCEFKPMDWCLMKYKGHYNNRGWELCQYAYTEHRASPFGNKGKDFYHAVGGEIYDECLPYNDSTKHLLGTTDEWKGGEG